MQERSLRTEDRAQLVEVTSEVQEFVSQSGQSTGIVLVYVPHTTAGITINENADPTVIHDILADLERLVPWSQEYYRHREGNSSSHTRASLMGSSVMVPFEDGNLKLGTWQGVFFCEFDGPRQRRYWLSVVASASGD